jgi:hypothetical protein
MLGFAGWYDNQPIGYFILHSFSAFMDRSYHFFTPKFTESLFQIFEKRSTSFNARIAISTIHYCYLVMTNSFFDYYFYKNGMDKTLSNGIKN